MRPANTIEQSSLAQMLFQELFQELQRPIPRLFRSHRIGPHDREARRAKDVESGCVVPPTQAVWTWVGILVSSYMLPASVSWWNGDNHLPPFFCQIEVAKTFPACFLPSQVASCVAAYVMTTVSLSSHI